MAVADLQHTILTSNKNIDQILGTYSGSLTISGTGSTFTFVTYDISAHTLGEKCFVKGIISFDSGTSWQDAGWIGRIPVSPFQSSIIIPAVSDGNVLIGASNNGVAFGIMYKLFIFARPGQGPQNPPSTPVLNKTTFSSKYNYQKIAFDVSTFSSSFAHNLGYIPKVSIFGTFTLNGVDVIAPNVSNDPSYVSATSVSTSSVAAPGYPNYFRVYHD